VELWKALKQLYPDAVPFVDYEIRDDGSGAYIAAWHLQAPQPTEAELAAAIVAYDAAQQTAATEASALRTRVVNLAQSAVGVQIDLLSAAQRNALLAALLYKTGAIDKNGAIRPLQDWVK
jgi:hypothetical protein